MKSWTETNSAPGAQLAHRRTAKTSGTSSCLARRRRTRRSTGRRHSDNAAGSCETVPEVVSGTLRKSSVSFRVGRSGRAGRRQTSSGSNRFRRRKNARSSGEAEAQRLFPQGRGLVALFSGPPRTGKTMAAQVIGARLNAGSLSCERGPACKRGWVNQTRRTSNKSFAWPRRTTWSCFSMKPTRCLPGALQRSAMRRIASPTRTPLTCCRRSRVIRCGDSRLDLKTNIDAAFLRQVALRR